MRRLSLFNLFRLYFLFALYNVNVEAACEQADNCWYVDYETVSSNYFTTYDFYFGNIIVGLLGSVNP